MPGDAEVLDLLRFRASADVIVSEVVAISLASQNIGSGGNRRPR